MLNGDAHHSQSWEFELCIWPLPDYQILERQEHNRTRRVDHSQACGIEMAKFRYYKRTFLAPASSRTSSYIIAEVESSYEGEYDLGTNMLTIADCRRQIQLEFFLGNPRDRQRSLAKAQLLADIINTFCAGLSEEAKLIEKTEQKLRTRAVAKTETN